MKAVFYSVQNSNDGGGGQVVMHMVMVTVTHDDVHKRLRMMVAIEI